MMIEALAGRDAFTKLAGHVRFTTAQIPQIGTMRLRSISALEYAQIESLTIRAAMASQGNKTARQIKALAETNAEIIRLVYVDADGNPVFSEDDKNMLMQMDSSISGAMASAAMEHCGINGADLETIAKNSAATSDDSSPSG